MPEEPAQNPVAQTKRDPWSALKESRVPPVSLNPPPKHCAESEVSYYPSENPASGTSSCLGLLEVKYKSSELPKQALNPIFIRSKSCFAALLGEVARHAGLARRGHVG